MWKPELASPGVTSAVLRYGLAVVSVALATALALLTDVYEIHSPDTPLFLVAVAVTVWYAGPGPAALAVVLSSASYDYFFTEPRYAFNFGPSDRLNVLVFVLFAFVIGWFSSRRRRIDRELRQARDDLATEVVERARQASLLNLTHDSIFVRDMGDVITYWNRGSHELYGWTPTQAIGERAHELLQTVFPVPLDEVHEELLRTGRWEGELRKTRADGTPVVVSSRWALVRDEQERPVAILTTNNDITDRKRREREIQGLNQELAKHSTELEAINQELEAFAYSVSHDLRAPLRHMAGYAELLHKSASSLLDEQGRRYVTMIRESAKRMGNLIDDLLAFSRVGRAEMKKAMVSLDQALKDALNEIRPETDGRNIAWTIGALPEVYGDRSLLRLVMVNLISNAVKFTQTRPRGEIEIGCTEAQDEIVVFIRDNGVGFEMKYANKLFGVFQRLHRAEEFEGTGIGLATVQRVIHRHGGRAWAEGAVDRGATFYFSLPKSSAVKS